MLILVISASLAGAFCNALAAVLQREVTGQPDPSRLFRLGFLYELFTHKRWLLGEVVDIFGFLLQALALWQGSLVVVMPVMSMELVLLMLFLHFRYKIKAGKREWFAVGAVSVGVSVFIIVSGVTGGKMSAGAHVLWLDVISVTALAVLFGALVVRNLSSSRLRALVAGFITGVNFALSAVLTKVVVGQLEMGIPYVLTHWFFYALLVALLIGFLNIQSTYGAGSLAVSQPVIEVTNPLVSIFFGVILFGDALRLGPLTLLIEVLSIGLFVWGIILLTRSKTILYSRQ